MSLVHLIIDEILVIIYEIIKLNNNLKNIPMKLLLIILIINSLDLIFLLIKLMIKYKNFQ